MINNIKSRQFLLLVRFIITMGLLFIVYRSLNLENFIVTLTSFNKLHLILAGILVFLHVFLKSYKWYMLSRELHSETTFSEALRSYLRGTSMAIVTPLRIGELGRVVGMKGSRLRLGSFIFIDTLSELWVIVCFVLLGGQKILVGYTSLVKVLILSLILLFLYQIRRLHELISRHIPYLFIRHILHGFSLVSWPLSNIILLLSFLTICIYFLQAYILLSAFVSVELSTVLTVFPLVLLTNLIPITIGSLGVREGAAIYLMSRFGITSEVAVAVSLLLFTFDTVIPAVVGSFLFLQKTATK